MKRVKIVLFLSLIVMIACSCTSGMHNLTASGVEAWLHAKATAAPTVELTGRWDAGSAVAGGWGEGNFVQEEANFSGSLGLYYIKGVVSGSEVHFALTSNEKVYYTGTMAQTGPERFSGKAVKYAFVDAEAAKTAETYFISMQKMN
jgi:hypothetical protein